MRLSRKGALVVLLGVLVLMVSVAAADEASIKTVGLTNEVDGDNDGKLSHFDLNIVADTTCIGCNDEGDDDIEPMFIVHLVGEDGNEVKMGSSGVVENKPEMEHVYEVPDDKLQAFDTQSLTVRVTLMDDDPLANDEMDKLSFEVDYERPSEDEAEISAEVVSVSAPSGEFHEGQEVTSEIEVKNTGDVAHEFFVGYGVRDANDELYSNDGSTGTTVELEPGETKTLELTWTVQSNAPTGTYDVGARIWQESDTNNLENVLDTGWDEDAFEVVEEPTPTPTPTPSPTASPSPTPPPTSPPPTEGSDGDGSGATGSDSTPQSTVLKDSDGDGVANQNDYAPNDSEVQDKEDVTSSELPGFGLGIALFAILLAMAIAVTRRR